MLEFGELFLALGATTQPLPTTYANILQSLHLSSAGKELDPQELEIAHKATNGFMKLLADQLTQEAHRPTDFAAIQSQIDQIEELYLLSADSCLKKSSSLVFNDQPKFRNRLKNFEHFQKNQLIDSFDYQQVKSFPKLLRPRLLSDIVFEVLAEDESPSCPVSLEVCKLKNRFNLRLSDPFFKQGLLRIANHISQKENKRLDENISELIQYVCEIKVECRQSLETRLQYLDEDGRTIETPIHETDCFSDQSGAVLVSHNKIRKPILCRKLADKIIKELGFPLPHPSKEIVGAMLACESPEDISTELDEFNILDQQSILEQERNRLKPGSAIKPQFHGFLLQNPNCYFYDGEWIGYKMADTDNGSDDSNAGSDVSEDEYNVLFILGRVLNEMPQDNEKLEQNFGRMYKVYIGDEEPLIVRAHELFKFCRPKTDWPLVLSDDTFDIEETTDLPESFDEAKNEIDETIKIIAMMTQDERKKVVHRLYLRWHPDKNSDDVKDLCTEAFKYLKQKLSQLDSKLDTEPGQSHSPFTSSVHRWDSQARYHAKQRTQRGQEHQRSSHFSSNSTPRVRIPDPKESGRWFKQAHSDLTAAMLSLQSFRSQVNLFC